MCGWRAPTYGSAHRPPPHQAGARCGAALRSLLPLLPSSAAAWGSASRRAPPLHCSHTPFAACPARRPPGSIGQHLSLLPPARANPYGEYYLDGVSLNPFEVLFVKASLVADDPARSWPGARLEGAAPGSSVRLHNRWLLPPCAAQVKERVLQNDWSFAVQAKKYTEWMEAQVGAAGGGAARGLGADGMGDRGAGDWGRPAALPTSCLRRTLIVDWKLHTWLMAPLPYAAGGWHAGRGQQRVSG